jgi:hypothetical protein
VVEGVRDDPATTVSVFEDMADSTPNASIAQHVDRSVGTGEDGSLANMNTDPAQGSVILGSGEG